MFLKSFRQLQSWAVAAALGGSLWSVQGDALANDNPVEIMDRVFKRADGDHAVKRVKLTMKDQLGHERQRDLQMLDLDFKEGTRRLIFFEAPADVRNVGLLTYDYDTGQKDDDQWLYLPSLRRSTRILSNKKSDAFMGSDFSYSDMTKDDPAQYDLELREASAKVGDEECWVIEERPKNEKYKEETGYVKKLVWVSKSKLLTIQLKGWLTQGQKLKYIKLEDLRQLDGIWTSMRLTARTVQNETMLSETVLSVLEASYGSSAVSAEQFTQGRLERGL